jgi:hypothetical protein
VVIGGEITKVEKKTTKKGDPFANVTIGLRAERVAGQVLEASPGEYEQISSVGNTIMVAGKTDEWNGFIP